MTDLNVIPLVDEGLGNSAYLVDLGDGRALAVDVSRDLRAVRQAAEANDLQVAFAADTHLHADFLTGAVQLARSDGAQVIGSEAGDRQYPHLAVADEDEVDLGGLRLGVLSTPGHTHEHVAFELLDGAGTVGVFTGGSLIVGSAARTDLVAPERTEELARAQYRSLQRLATLDDEVRVWPTHGAGSFCSAPPGSERTSTIGTERATNSLLRAKDEDSFVRELLDSLGTFPPYFLRLGEISRQGPALVGEDDRLSNLSLAQVQQLHAHGAAVVDVRPVEDFSTAHIPGSVSIPLRPVFATWLGWLTEHDQALVIVRNEDQDPQEVLWQARKIGHDQIAGELDGGLPAWTSAGLPTAAIPLTGADALAGRSVIDVRQQQEFDTEHIPGARNVELGLIPMSAAELELPSGPTTVMCGHGERAMSAASMLARTGRTDITVLEGGPQEWAEATNSSVEVGG